MPIRSVIQSSQLIRNFGSQLTFDGTTGIVTLGTTNPFANNSFYFGAYITWAGLNGGFQTIFAKRNAYGATTMMFAMSLDATLGTLNVDSVTGFVQSGLTFTVGRRTHLLWVHDKTANRDKFYINGELASNQAIGTLGTGVTGLISVGGCQSPSADWFNGKIDNVTIGIGLPKVSQVDPSIDEVFELYSKGRMPATRWARLKFDEGSGAVATDSSGSGNHGVIIGATYT